MDVETTHAAENYALLHYERTNEWHMYVRSSHQTVPSTRRHPAHPVSALILSGIERNDAPPTYYYYSRKANVGIIRCKK